MADDGECRWRLTRPEWKDPMTTMALSTRSAIALTVAGLISSASLVFGFAGTAHAHGTWTPPQPVPHSPAAHSRQGPFSVLHQGPFSVLHEGIGP
jgi:hypothetical protein